MRFVREVTLKYLLTSDIPSLVKVSQLFYNFNGINQLKVFYERI